MSRGEKEAARRNANLMHIVQDREAGSRKRLSQLNVLPENSPQRGNKTLVRITRQRTD